MLSQSPGSPVGRSGPHVTVHDDEAPGEAFVVSGSEYRELLRIAREHVTVLKQMFQVKRTCGNPDWSATYWDCRQGLSFEDARAVSCMSFRNGLTVYEVLDTASRSEVAGAQINVSFDTVEFYAGDQLATSFDVTTIVEMYHDPARRALVLVLPHTSFEICCYDQAVLRALYYAMLLRHTDLRTSIDPVAHTQQVIEAATPAALAEAGSPPLATPEGQLIQVSPNSTVAFATPSKPVSQASAHVPPTRTPTMQSLPPREAVSGRSSGAAFGAARSQAASQPAAQISVPARPRSQAADASHPQQQQQQQQQQQPSQHSISRHASMAGSAPSQLQQPSGGTQGTAPGQALRQLSTQQPQSGLPHQRMQSSVQQSAPQLATAQSMQQTSLPQQHSMFTQPRGQQESGPVSLSVSELTHPYSNQLQQQPQSQRMQEPQRQPSQPTMRQSQLQPQRSQEPPQPQGTFPQPLSQQGRPPAGHTSRQSGMQQLGSFRSQHSQDMFDASGASPWVPPSTPEHQRQSQSQSQNENQNETQLQDIVQHLSVAAQQTQLAHIQQQLSQGQASHHSQAPQEAGPADVAAQPLPAQTVMSLSQQTSHPSQRASFHSNPV